MTNPWGNYHRSSSVVVRYLQFISFIFFNYPYPGSWYAPPPANETGRGVQESPTRPGGESRKRGHEDEDKDEAQDSTPQAAPQLLTPKTPLLMRA